MAEIILKSKLKLAGITDIKVKSAGLSAFEGDKISKNASLALKSMGLKGYAFRSRKVTDKMLRDADMIICMTEKHKQCLRNYDSVYSISELTGLEDISDPYGLDYHAYVKASHQLEDACNIILDKILMAKGV